VRKWRNGEWRMGRREQENEREEGVRFYFIKNES
jgi:hypothetical protein